MSSGLVRAASRRLAGLQEARVALHKALKVAFPVGSKVISHARAKPIHGVVVGVCGPRDEHAAGYTTAHYDGYVIVENTKTGKRHNCFALSENNGLEISE